MINNKAKTILITLRAEAKTKWREEITKVNSLGITELALLVDSFNLEQRKEVYRLIEKSGIKSIPFVQISNNFEEGELDYLSTIHGTKIFSLYFDNTALGFINNLTKFLPYLAPENTVEKKFVNLFSDETLTKINVRGVCLNLTTLEYDRHYDKKKYKATIQALDHHSLLATKVGPIQNSRLSLALHLKSTKLTTLSDLHYLRMVPKNYLADTIVLDFKNNLEEQLEIKSYLELMFK